MDLKVAIMFKATILLPILKTMQITPLDPLMVAQKPQDKWETVDTNT